MAVCSPCRIVKKKSHSRAATDETLLRTCSMLHMQFISIRMLRDSCSQRCNSSSASLLVCRSKLKGKCTAQNQRARNSSTLICSQTESFTAQAVEYYPATPTRRVAIQAHHVRRQRNIEVMANLLWIWLNSCIGKDAATARDLWSCRMAASI